MALAKDFYGEIVITGNGSPVKVLMRDSSGNALLATGTTVPTNASSGYAKGCTFIDTDTASTVNGVYVNNGTSTSCLFVASGQTQMISTSGAITTTGNSDVYIMAPQAGFVTGAFLSAIDALAANDTNYLTFSITNLGQAGAGTAVMLAATAANTTKVTGGTAIAANTKRTLTLTATGADLAVAQGDRLLIRAAATGTLANAVNGAVYMLTFG